MNVYKVRFEARVRGSLGTFNSIGFTVEATDPSHARATAFELAQQSYETRMGGDYYDGKTWRATDGREMPMCLPCELEWAVTR